MASLEGPWGLHHRPEVQDTSGQSPSRNQRSRGQCLADPGTREPSEAGPALKGVRSAPFQWGQAHRVCPECSAGRAGSVVAPPTFLGQGRPPLHLTMLATSPSLTARWWSRVSLTGLSACVRSGEG